MTDNYTEYHDAYLALSEAKPGTKDKPDDVIDAVSYTMKNLILYGLTPEAFKITLLMLQDMLKEVLDKLEAVSNGK